MWCIVLICLQNAFIIPPPLSRFSCFTLSIILIPEPLGWGMLPACWLSSTMLPLGFILFRDTGRIECKSTTCFYVLIHGERTVKATYSMISLGDVKMSVMTEAELTNNYTRLSNGFPWTSLLLLGRNQSFMLYSSDKGDAIVSTTLINLISAECNVNG